MFMTWIILFTDSFLLTFINRSINILLEFGCFCHDMEQRAPFSTMFAWELSTVWYDYRIVTYKFQYSWRVGSISNKKGSRALSPWKLRRTLWKANVWPKRPLKIQDTHWCTAFRFRLFPLGPQTFVRALKELRLRAQKALWNLCLLTSPA